MKTKRPYSSTLQAIIDGETDFEIEAGGAWNPASVGRVLAHISCESVDPKQIRIKPKTRTINGIVVPEPYFGPMETSQEYYMADCDGDRDYRHSVWANDEWDKLRLKRGLIHLSRENAEAWAKAWRATCAPETVSEGDGV